MDTPSVASHAIYRARQWSLHPIVYAYCTNRQQANSEHFGRPEALEALQEVSPSLPWGGRCLMRTIRSCIHCRPQHLHTKDHGQHLVGLPRWAIGVLTRNSKRYRASRCLYLHRCSARLTRRLFTLHYSSRRPNCQEMRIVRAWTWLFPDRHQYLRICEVNDVGSKCSPRKDRAR